MRSASRSDPGQLDPRHEIKFVVAETDARAFGLDLVLRAQGYRALFPDRIVQSVYLDGPLRPALAENLAGVSHREKLRFRWYGAETRGVRGRLECKVREGGLGWKRISGSLAPPGPEGANRHAFVRELREAVPATMRSEFARALEPAQWIRYRRSYLRSALGGVRLTIDRDLALYDQRRRVLLAPTEALPITRRWVIELKCATEDADELRACAAALPLVADRHSKFVTAEEPTARPQVHRLLHARLAEAFPRRSRLRGRS